MTPLGQLVDFASTPAGHRAASEATSVRPFTFRAGEAELEDLRRRVVTTQFPEKEPVADRSQGVPLATIRKLARYWATEYDWRKVEAKLGSYPQFIMEIDGLDIHFIHVRSEHPNALPILVTHGWPGSIIHNLKIIDPLVDPTAHGGKPSEAFDVVIPSMPGFGFSGKPATTGWDPVRIARAWNTLMKRLGYTRYVAQGGDWGAIIVEQMATQRVSELIGIHSNMPGAVPPELDAKASAGAPPRSGLSPEEERAYTQLASTYKNVQYAFYMGSRPQTLYALADSPVGLAAFTLDFDPKGLDLITRLFDGERAGLTRDDVLDNITLYWLTNTAVSAARLYWENRISYFAPKNVTIPVAVSAFPEELFQTPRSWAERAFPNLIHYNKPDKGGHFPAREQPELFVAELRAGFKSLR